MSRKQEEYGENDRTSIEYGEIEVVEREGKDWRKREAEQRFYGLKYCAGVKFTAFIVMGIMIFTCVASIMIAAMMWDYDVWENSKEEVRTELYRDASYDSGAMMFQNYVMGNAEYIELNCGDSENIEFEIIDGLTPYQTEGVDTKEGLIPYEHVYAMSDYYYAYELDIVDFSTDTMAGTELETIITDLQAEIARVNEEVVETEMSESTVTGEMTETVNAIEIAEPIEIDPEVLEAYEAYEVNAIVYVDPQLAVVDGYFIIDKALDIAYMLKDVMGIIMVGAGILAIGLFIFLMQAVGYRRTSQYPVVCGTARIPYEVFMGATVTMGGVFLALGMEQYYCDGMFYRMVMAGMLVCAFMSVVLAFFDFLVRFRTGTLISNCLVVKVWKKIQPIKLMKKCMRWLWKVGYKIGKAVPLMWKGIAVYAGIVIWSIPMLMIYDYWGRIVLWWMLNVVLVPLGIYCYLMFRRMQLASKAIGEGELSYKVDTKLCIMEFKEMADSLNSISNGMEVAVEEKMKSERMKTELISNVSHDIKTPLTSIVNYADLISKEDTENEKIHEYSAILLRQADRLKRLTEDLVHASKVTSGNVEIQLTPCDVGVLLSQAVGEYEQKLLDARLNVVLKLPQEGISIIADGRHLWRVFDNLLNNICKYAQEGTRVYLVVKKEEQAVYVEFKNISKYELNITEEELMERFVRGDKSRHSEGNGLGLSIAKSLVEVQGGRMDLAIDGDLFKVILRF